ncbi:lysophospholipid acyltransferase family protein [Acanthopleuribacter pedis]|uniref:Lysophospholipid acyltransferase family protein n=1 Tax=Acanthopleuribacter pedis TaxID=442870 RepID=A0A8J7U295_9BACT|nr:lysophospholipid acyltransferase family protein [Acanthopleuribacter pedis]MBO1317474.1 lysophospholipid acyltransferase family protein [Acanthopleuribacter pedis]
MAKVKGPKLWLFLRRTMGQFYLKLAGFKVVGEVPDVDKHITLAVPHTTNWDMPHMLFYCFATEQEISFMMKASVFRPPFGRLFRALGGIPIDRSKKNNMVDQVAEQFAKHETLNVVIPPSGTRRRGDYWRTGFYYIALAAKVPIICGFLDWGHKEVGYGRVIIPSGDIEADFELIREFYESRGVKGKFPEKQSTIKPRPANSKSIMTDTDPNIKLEDQPITEELKN